MPWQKVGAGETTMSIAKKNGFFWETIWNHPQNAALKAKRVDPNVLFEDDDIFIPEKKPKEESKASESEYVFKLKGTPAKLKIQMLKLGQPRANAKYVLQIAEELIEGVTDGDGKIEHFIPPDASSAQLIFKDGKEPPYNLRLGNLDPLDLLSGVRQRLNNLGHSTGGESGGEITEKTKEALKSFQAAHNLNITGEIDSATKAMLKKLSK